MTLSAISAGHLSIVEPTDAEVLAHAAHLSSWYSHPENMRLMAATEPMTEDEVIDFYRDGRASGSRMFLIFDRGELVGDADFREIRGERAEFAILIGPPTHKGRGIGTGATSAMHHFGFLHLGFRRVVLSVSKHNEAALRLYRKVGYHVDTSKDAADSSDHHDDVTMSVTPERFYKLFPEIGRSVSILER